jgi:hypothetical protein
MCDFCRGEWRGQLVAVKEVNEVTKENFAKKAKLFKEEIEMLNRFKGDSKFVQLVGHGVNEADCKLSIVFELMHESLSQVLRRWLLHPVELAAERVKVAIACVRAVQHLHTYPFEHADQRRGMIVVRGRGAHSKALLRSSDSMRCCS